MPNAKKTVEVKLGLRKIACGVLDLSIICFFSFILIISGAKILWEYYLLLYGYMPLDVQKMALDYSFTIFWGCVLFLTVYQPLVKRGLLQMLGIKKDAKPTPN